MENLTRRELILEILKVLYEAESNKVTWDCLKEKIEKKCGRLLNPNVIAYPLGLMYAEKLIDSKRRSYVVLTEKGRQFYKFVLEHDQKTIEELYHIIQTYRKLLIEERI